MLKFSLPPTCNYTRWGIQEIISGCARPSLLRPDGWWTYSAQLKPVACVTPVSLYNAVSVAGFRSRGGFWQRWGSFQAWSIL